MRHADKNAGMVRVATGVVLLIAGAIWILQGLDIAFAPESFMTGDRFWSGCCSCWWGSDLVGRSVTPTRQRLRRRLGLVWRPPLKGSRVPLCALGGGALWCRASALLYELGDGDDLVGFGYVVQEVEDHFGAG